jgi:hypothetical protein
MIAARELEERAIELRIAGLSYREIAERLGCARQSAQDAVRRALDRQAAESVAKVERLRALQGERIERAIQAIWDQVERGQLGAIDRLYRLCVRQAALYGLDLQPGAEERSPRVHVAVQTGGVVRVTSADGLEAAEGYLPGDKEDSLEQRLAAAGVVEGSAIVVDSRPLSEIRAGLPSAPG